MTDKDRMTLNPWEKWRKYHRIPFKVILQVMVLILVFIQIYFVVGQFTETTRGNREAFRRLFLPEDAPDPDNPQPALYSVEDFLAALNKTVQNYYAIAEMGLSNFTYAHTEHGAIAGPLLSYTVHAVAADNATLTPQTYTKFAILSLENPLGPFEGADTDAEVKKLIYSLIRVTISFTLYNHEFVAVFGTTTFRWDIELVLEGAGGTLMPSLTVTKIFPLLASQFTPFSYLLVAIITLCSLSFLLSLKAIYAGYRVYQRCKERYNAIPRKKLEKFFQKTNIVPVCLSWDEIPSSVKFSFFSSWHAFSAFGDLSILISAVMSLFRELGSPMSDWARVFLGLGALILCTNMTKYFEYEPGFYTLILTLKLSGLRIIKFIISTIPLLAGYILCGLVLFSPFSVRFWNLDRTAVSLFALLNGDDIHATFDELALSYPMPWVSRIYLYTFALLTITAVLNIFIYIIEDAYHLAKVLSGADSLERGQDSIHVDPDAILLWQELKLVFSIDTLFLILDRYYHRKQQRKFKTPMPSQPPSPRTQRRMGDKMKELGEKEKEVPKANGAEPRATDTPLAQTPGTLQRSRMSLKLGAEELDLMLGATSEDERVVFARAMSDHDEGFARDSDERQRLLPQRAVSIQSSSPHEGDGGSESGDELGHSHDNKRDALSYMAAMHPNNMKALDIIQTRQQQFLQEVQNSIERLQQEFLEGVNRELRQLYSLPDLEEEEVGVWEEVDEDDEVPVHINVSSPGDFL